MRYAREIEGGLVPVELGTTSFTSFLDVRVGSRNELIHLLPLLWFQLLPERSCEEDEHDERKQDERPEDDKQDEGHGPYHGQARLWCIENQVQQTTPVEHHCLIALGKPLLRRGRRRLVKRVLSAVPML